jgi:hypothetical protein
MGAQLTETVVQTLLVPVLTALAAAVVGLIGYLGAAAKRALDAIATRAQASTHAMDVQVLVDVLGRKALAEVADHRTPAPSAAELIEYLARVKPDLLAKMQPSEEGLAVMARSAIAKAEVALTTPTVVAPSDVLVTPGG